MSLAVYLLAATGIPLPVHAYKDPGRPFPCQHHACGCTTAEQCWKQCCCYTPKEKLEWAHRHGVTPPLALVVEVATGSPHEHPPAARPCCADERTTCHEPARDCDAADHQHSSTCDHDADDHGQAESTACRACSSPAKAGLVLGILAQKCRGLSTLWCATGAVTPPPASTTWSFHWITVGWVDLSGSTAASIGRIPLERPPCA